MTSTQPITFLATDYSNPHVAPVQWAVSLAEKVGPAVKAGSSVVISFVGIRGTASSYFNALLLKLLEFAPRDEILKRVTFATDSAAQGQLLDRSVQAVLYANGTGRPVHP